MSPWAIPLRRHDSKVRRAFAVSATGFATLLAALALGGAMIATGMALVAGGAQAGAYATGVLAVITSASVAVF
ncbi:MAG: hypothetical protein L0K86_25615, partial [Actinomycetia bacterium]|nr:hypothetical protein [Actinomycetes bacterium]